MDVAVVRELLAVLREAGVNHFEMSPDGAIKVGLGPAAPAAQRVAVDGTQEQMLATLVDLSRRSAV